MAGPVRRLWYVKYYSLSSTAVLGHFNYSISNKCQKVISRTRSEAKISDNKVTTSILKLTEFSNTTNGLNTLVTIKQPKNDFLKKR